MTDADLTDADVTDADLTDADLTDSDLTDRARRATTGADVQTRATLRAALVDLFGIPAADVVPGAELEADLALDSLSVVELQVALEEALGVRVDVADPAEVRTVADLERVLDGAVERGEPAVPTLHLVADEPGRPPEPGSEQSTGGPG